MSVLGTGVPTVPEPPSILSPVACTGSIAGAPRALAQKSFRAHHMQTSHCAHSRSTCSAGAACRRATAARAAASSKPSLPAAAPSTCSSSRASVHPNPTP